MRRFPLSHLTLVSSRTRVYDWSVLDPELADDDTPLLEREYVDAAGFLRTELG